jgi:hypothetical protein
VGATVVLVGVAESIEDLRLHPIAVRQHVVESDDQQAVRT